MEVFCWVWPGLLYPLFLWWGRRASDSSTGILVNHEQRLTQAELAIKALVSSNAAGIAELRGLIEKHTKADEEALTRITKALDLLVQAAAAHDTWMKTLQKRAAAIGRASVYGLVGIWVLWNMKNDPAFLKDHWGPISWVLTHLPI